MISRIHRQIPFNARFVPLNRINGARTVVWNRNRVAAIEDIADFEGPLVDDEDWLEEGEEDIAAVVDNGLDWVFRAGEKLEAQVAAEAAEERLVEIAGLNSSSRGAGGGTHIQGRNISTDVINIDENDPKRHIWHQKLHLCAEQGDFGGAEEVLANMRQQKSLPGPRAHHALIISYVKGNNPRGALLAIRNAWTKKIQPLPQSYAAVVHAFLQQGDLETAIAVYAANRRTPVSSEKSWAALTTALFNSRDYERAVALLDLGIQEGFQPDKRMYEAMIKYHCRLGNLAEAMDILGEMKKRSWRCNKDHFSHLVTAHALAGEIGVAEVLLREMVDSCTGTPSAPAVGSINSMLHMYLGQRLPAEVFAAKIAELRQSSLRAGIPWDRKSYSLLLESSVYLEDPQIGMLALKALRSQGRGSLQYLQSDIIEKFLLQLSQASGGNLTTVFEAITIMSYQGVMWTGDLTTVDDYGRTFLTAWMAPPTEEDEMEIVVDAEDSEESSEESDETSEESSEESDAEPAEKEWLVIDDISLDPENLCAVNEDGVALPVTKMAVKELRAELSARQSPLRGNKKELIRQLQRARAEADIVGSVLDVKDGSKRVEVMVLEESWSVGRLADQKVYENERVLEDDDDDDDEGATLDEEEEDEDAPARRAAADDEDDYDFDYDFEYTMMKAQGKFNIKLSSSEPSIGHAIAISQGLLAMGGVPSVADLVAFCKSVKGVKESQVHERLKTVLSDKRLADRLTPAMNAFL